jgi:hypothetical protein
MVTSCRAVQFEIPRHYSEARYVREDAKSSVETIASVNGSIYCNFKQNRPSQ